MTLEELAAEMRAGFTQVNERLDGLESKVDGLAQRQDVLESTCLRWMGLLSVKMCLSRRWMGLLSVKTCLSRRWMGLLILWMIVSLTCWRH